MAVRLIVGLGNHGHISMRHSVGMQAVNHLASMLGATWRDHRECHATLAEIGDNVFLMRPKQLMNINGESVGKVFRQLRIPEPSMVMLIHDDLDVELGKVRVKAGGSAKGNNGVKSVIQHLRSDVMPRLRIGIGRPDSREANHVVEHVLGAFSAEEQAQLFHTVLPLATKMMLEKLGRSGSQKA